MWAFKELYDKGLIYQGFRVLPYSWAEHTPLSNQETRLDDSYRERQDPTVTVALPVRGARQRRIDDRLDLVEGQHEFRQMLLLQIIPQRVVVVHVILKAQGSGNHPLTHSATAVAI